MKKTTRRLMSKTTRNNDYTMRSDMIQWVCRLPKDNKIVVFTRGQEDYVIAAYDKREELEEAWRRLQVAIHEALETVQAPYFADEKHAKRGGDDDSRA